MALQKALSWETTNMISCRGISSRLTRGLRLSGLDLHQEAKNKSAFKSLT